MRDDLYGKDTRHRSAKNTGACEGVCLAQLKNAVSLDVVGDDAGALPVVATNRR